MILIRTLLFACAMSVALVYAQQQTEQHSVCWNVVFPDGGLSTSHKTSTPAKIGTKLPGKGLPITKDLAVTRNIPPGAKKKPPSRRRDIHNDPNYSFCQDEYVIPSDWQIYLDSTTTSSSNLDNPGWTGPNAIEAAKNCGRTIKVQFSDENNFFLTEQVYTIVGFYRFADNASDKCISAKFNKFPPRRLGQAKIAYYYIATYAYALY